LKEVVNVPLLYCFPEDSLEKKLNYMNEKEIRRLYVLDRSLQVVGVLAYSDIVGILYRLCRKCNNNIFKQRQSKDFDYTQRILVKDAMSRDVKYSLSDVTIRELIENLSESRLGALLIKDRSKVPVGVASKTDLIWAYKHQVPCGNRIEQIMSRLIFSCPEDDFLAKAIHKMIINDVQRFFVHKKSGDNIVGVLSLSDAARARSGSCKACSASRMPQ